MNKKAVGDIGEIRAQKYLKKIGYKICEKNAKIAGVEVDIIALDQRTIVFIEVKTRSNSDFMMPSEAVDIFKQKRYSKAMLAYVVSKNLFNIDLRFDVVEVVGDTINHIKNAYEIVR